MITLEERLIKIFYFFYIYAILSYKINLSELAICQNEQTYSFLRKGKIYLRF